MVNKILVQSKKILIALALFLLPIAIFIWYLDYEEQKFADCVMLPEANMVIKAKPYKILKSNFVKRTEDSLLKLKNLFVLIIPSQHVLELVDNYWENNPELDKYIDNPIVLFNYSNIETTKTFTGFLQFAKEPDLLQLAKDLQQINERISPNCKMWNNSTMLLYWQTNLPRSQFAKGKCEINILEGSERVELKSQNLRVIFAKIGKRIVFSNTHQELDKLLERVRDGARSTVSLKLKEYFSEGRKSDFCLVTSQSFGYAVQLDALLININLNRDLSCNTKILFSDYIQAALCKRGADYVQENLANILKRQTKKKFSQSLTTAIHNFTLGTKIEMSLRETTINIPIKQENVLEISNELMEL